MIYFLNYTVNSSFNGHAYVGLDGAKLYKLVGGALYVPNGCYYYEPDRVISLTGTTQEDCIYQCQVSMKCSSLNKITPNIHVHYVARDFQEAIYFLLKSLQISELL